MTRRVLDVAIRTEFKKGFGDIAKQFSALENTLKKVEGSVNKLADNIDRQLSFKQAQYGAKKFAENQRVVNKTVDDGIRIAKRYESAHTVLGRNLASLNAAQKAGSLNQKQRMEAEIGLLSQYIKKTNDLSVLEAKNNKFRDSKGRFVNFTKDSLQSVSENLAKATEAGLAKGAKNGTNVVVAQMKATSSRIRGAVERIGASGYQTSFGDRNQQAAFYDAVWGSRGQRNGAGLGTQALVNRNVGVRSANADTGLMLGDDAGFNRLKLQYQQLEQKADATGAKIRRQNFGPNPAVSEPAFKKLMDSYNKLGYVLFQLQYTTLTIFGLSGIGMIIQQADAFITLRNQVARTSDSLDDLGANMKDVYAISMQTFSDPKVVGNMFSRINKYSDALGLSREEVTGVVGGISGAFAASPGNAAEKSASQYQFMQAIQSNRLGGDELRSVLEMAPYVGDILGKGIARVRGQEGVIDLRAQGDAGTPVTAKEIVAVFNDPAIQKEIREMLGRQSRTFGDLLMVGKTRLMQMTEQFMNSTGVFSGIINSLSKFLSNDEQFAKFTNALTTATLALVTYGGMITAQAGIKGAANVIGGVGARMGIGRNALGIVDTIADANGNATATRGVGANGSRLWGNTMSNAGVNAMYAAANRDNRAFNRGARVVDGAMKGGRAGLGEAAIAGLSVALNGLKNPLSTAKSGITTLSSSVKGAGSVVASSAKNMASGLGVVASQGKIGSSIMKGLGVAARSLAGFLSPVLALFTGLSIPLIVIASIIALLAARFNQLLGAMTGGMNIMDVLLGLWDKLGRALGWIAGKIDDLTGGLFSGLGKAIDWVLSKLAFLAKNDVDMQRRQASRMAGSQVFDGSAGVFDRNGNIVEARINEAKDGQKATVSALEGGRILRRADQVTATDRAAAFQNGEWLLNPGVDPALPTGNKADLPTTPVKAPKGGQGRKDPWPEFLRDLNLKVQSVTDLRNVAPGLRDIQGNLNENLRRAMDVMNFDSSKFDTLSQAWEAFSNSNAGKAAEVNRLNERLKSEKLIEAYRDFTDTLADTLIGMQREARSAGMSSFAADLYSNLNSLTDEYLNSEAFKGTREEYDMFKQMQANGGVFVSDPNNDNGFTGNIKDYVSPENRLKFEQQLAAMNEATRKAAINAGRRENELALQAFETYQASLNLFGKRREEQQEINDLTNNFLSTYGEIGMQDAQLVQMLQQQVELVKARYAAEREYQSIAGNGFREAIEEYKESLADVAGQTRDIFANALSGLEEGLVNFITTGKMEWGSLIQTMANDVSRMFVKQFVMKPITNFIEGIGGKMFGEAANDQMIQANNVYINSKPLDSILGNLDGGGWMGGVDGGFLGKLLGKGKEESETTGILGKLFSGAGSKGGGIMGTIGGMFGKAKGGLGSLLGMAGSFLPPPFNMLGSLFSLFHGGGTVGAASMSRIVNPSVFAGAVRYHTGTGHAGLPALGVNEVPAILQRGEKVLTAAQYSAMNGGSNNTSFSPSVSISYTAASDNSGKANPQEDAQLLADMVNASIQQALMDHEQKKLRPGSQSYLNGRKY